ncbi:hypothetical protein ABOM_002558 [Aspergillus bombycis]|uniref:Uncharacterized protein n=1 Tax=Aspergillus bombycis TaxID=109264 RepID=A0A1F8A6U9_9EURO|nr:hypothetical protein ABOM_002558 [Aspergillus bombycis]OGM47456.1 hypothetical protein ABOM_002558 [Aspergillus bombycis]
MTIQGVQLGNPTRPGLSGVSSVGSTKVLAGSGRVRVVRENSPRSDPMPTLKNKIPTANGWNGTILGAKDTDARLLTAQHYLWKELLGFLVHPDVDTRAAGYCIWLHHFARGKPPSIDLNGFDISLDQVGPKPWLPANVYMHTWNILEDVPGKECLI